MRFRKLRAADVKHLVIHCSATPPDMDIGREEIDRWHREDNGWLAIGYHYVIRRDGSVETGRPLDAMGAHVAGHNDTSIGICMIGGVDESNQPSDNFLPEQFEAAARLVAHLKDVYPGARMYGHNHFNEHKACPSFDVEILADGVHAIRNLID